MERACGKCKGVKKCQKRTIAAQIELFQKKTANLQLTEQRRNYRPSDLRLYLAWFCQVNSLTRVD